MTTTSTTVTVEKTLVKKITLLGPIGPINLPGSTFRGLGDVEFVNLQNNDVVYFSSQDLKWKNAPVSSVISFDSDFENIQLQLDSDENRFNLFLVGYVSQISNIQSRLQTLENINILDSSDVTSLISGYVDANISSIELRVSSLESDFSNIRTVDSADVLGIVGGYVNPLIANLESDLDNLDFSTIDSAQTLSIVSNYVNPIIVNLESDIAAIDFLDSGEGLSLINSVINPLIANLESDIAAIDFLDSAEALDLISSVINPRFADVDSDIALIEFKLIPINIDIQILQNRISQLESDLSADFLTKDSAPGIVSNIVNPRFDDVDSDILRLVNNLNSIESDYLSITQSVAGIESDLLNLEIPNTVDSAAINSLISLYIDSDIADINFRINQLQLIINDALDGAVFLDSADATQIAVDLYEVRVSNLESDISNFDPLSLEARFESIESDISLLSTLDSSDVSAITNPRFVNNENDINSLFIAQNELVILVENTVDNLDSDINSFGDIISNLESDVSNFISTGGLDSAQVALVVNDQVNPRFADVDSDILAVNTRIDNLDLFDSAQTTFLINSLVNPRFADVDSDILVVNTRINNLDLSGNIDSADVLSIVNTYVNPLIANLESDIANIDVIANIDSSQVISIVSDYVDSDLVVVNTKIENLESDLENLSIAPPTVGAQITISKNQPNGEIGSLWVNTTQREKSLYVYMVNSDFSSSADWYNLSTPLIDDTEFFDQSYDSDILFVTNKIKDLESDISNLVVPSQPGEARITISRDAPEGIVGSLWINTSQREKSLYVYMVNSDFSPIADWYNTSTPLIDDIQFFSQSYDSDISRIYSIISSISGGASVDSAQIISIVDSIVDSDFQSIYNLIDDVDSDVLLLQQYNISVENRLDLLDSSAANLSDRIDFVESDLANMVFPESGASVTYSELPPANPQIGDLWINSAQREKFLYTYIINTQFSNLPDWYNITLPSQDNMFRDLGPGEVEQTVSDPGLDSSQVTSIVGNIINPLISGLESDISNLDLSGNFDSAQAVTLINQTINPRFTEVDSDILAVNARITGLDLFDSAQTTSLVNALVNPRFADVDSDILALSTRVNNLDLFDSAQTTSFVNALVNPRFDDVDSDVLAVNGRINSLNILDSAEILVLTNSRFNGIDSDISSVENKNADQDSDISILKNRIQVKISVGTTAPVSPAINDLWVDTN